MKITLGTNQWFDDQGVPLVSGRISVFLHGSDTPADIFTLEGDTYVPKSNPFILTEDGRSSSTWFDATTVDVRVEKFVDPAYELIDTYSDGFEPTNARNDTMIYGMDALASANPELGTVTVVGFHNSHDCGPRTFVWDPTCTDNADGCAIVQSNGTENGRWILLSDERYMPSSWYGIKAGQYEANVSAFLTYPETVGQWSIQLPPVPRFMKGTYTTQGTISSTKVVAFDSGAKFPDVVLEVKSVEVMDNTDYVADFIFNDADFLVHSSWFKSVNYFWNCGASIFCLDENNYFADTQLAGVADMSNKTILGTTRIPMTYRDRNAYFRINNTVIGGKIFSPTADYVQVVDTTTGDKVFLAGAWDPGTIAAGHHVQYVNVPDLDNFENTSRWLEAMKERRARMPSQLWADYKLDLQGRYLSSVDVGLFTDIRNVVCGTMTVNNSQNFIWIHDCRVDSLNVTCAQLVVEDSTVTIGFEPVCPSVFFYRSQVTPASGSTAWTGTDYSVTAEGCTWGISLNRATDNIARDSAISFTDCKFQTNTTVRTKNLSMKDCLVGQATFEVYPWFDGTDYRINVYLSCNRFTGTIPFTITKFSGTDAFDRCFDCIPTWTIVGNMFTGNDTGIKCRYWSNRTGGYYDRQFIANSNDAAVSYYGNTGNCPHETARDIYGTDSDGNRLYVVTIAEGAKATMYKGYDGVQRIMPDLRYSISAPYHWSSRAIGGNGLCLKYYQSDNDLDHYRAPGIYPYYVLNALDDGDFFAYGFLWVEEIEEADPGHVHMWRYT